MNGQLFRRYTPLPDSVISGAMTMGAMNHVIDPSGMATPLGGFATPMASAFSSGLATPGWKTSTTPGSSTDLDLQKIGQARNRLMDIRLNQND
uniref:Uncharacterized protein n=1 Tax=Panagrolaimus superbus TaxID=310955 RepID=A0A914YW71_9BILA